MRILYDANGNKISKEFNPEILMQNQQVRTIAFGIAGGELGRVETGYNLKTPDYDHKSTTVPSVSATGFPAAGNGGTLNGAISVSDICMVGDELWFFSAASDDHLTYGTCWRLKYDPINNEMLEEPKFFWHDLCHANTASYDPNNDCLIMGNGGADYDLPNKIYIIPNASKIKEMGNGAVVSLADYGMEIDVSDRTEFGAKLNVFWSNTTGLVYKYAGDKMCTNMAYAYSDDGNKFHILVFGFDDFRYPMGTYVAPSGVNRFNGTYNILKTYQIGDISETIGNPGSYTHCGQGGGALGGSAFLGRGHSDTWYSEIVPNGDTFTETIKRIPNFNWQTGEKANNKVLGIEPTSNYLILARTGQSSNPIICFVPW